MSGTAILIFEDEGGMRYSDEREFVMCGECKYFRAYKGTNGGVGVCTLIDHAEDQREDWMDRYNDDFCSRGDPV